MTFLAFSIDGRRFALSAVDVVAVVPAAPLRAIDGAPSWLAGILRYFDAVVPVIDLGVLQAARPSQRAFATRIVLVRYTRAEGDARVLGVMAEGVTDVLEVAPGQWREPGLGMPETPWLGPVADIDGEFVQRVTVTDMLPPEVRERLFP